MEETRTFTITDENGNQTTVEGKVITTEDGVDKDGNPIRNVEIKIPASILGAVPGEIN